MFRICWIAAAYVIDTILYFFLLALCVCILFVCVSVCAVCQNFSTTSSFSVELLLLPGIHELNWKFKLLIYLNHFHTRIKCVRICSVLRYIQKKTATKTTTAQKQWTRQWQIHFFKQEKIRFSAIINFLWNALICEWCNIKRVIVDTWQMEKLLWKRKPQTNIIIW